MGSCPSESRLCGSVQLHYWHVQGKKALYPLSAKRQISLGTQDNRSGLAPMVENSVGQKNEQESHSPKIGAQALNSENERCKSINPNFDHQILLACREPYTGAVISEEMGLLAFHALLCPFPPLPSFS